MTATREGLLALREELAGIQSKSTHTADDLFRAEQIAEEIAEFGRKSVQDHRRRVAKPCRASSPRSAP